MIKKKSLLKISLILFAIFTVVALCMCSIFGTSKSAEAKANPSNDFSIILKCDSAYDTKQLDVWCEEASLDPIIVKEFDCTKCVKQFVEKVKPGAEWKFVPDKSYYGKSNLGTLSDLYCTMVNICIAINIDNEYVIGYFPFYVYECGTDSEDYINYLQYVNGKFVDLPIIESEEDPSGALPMSDKSYLFTDYPYSDVINISGNVVDEAGNAVDGAKVSVTPENVANAIVPDPVMTVNGTFAFEDVDQSILPATVNVEKDGYSFIPVRITENDVVDGKIVLSNLVLNKSTEVAQTMDINFYFVIALIGIALCGIIVAVASRSKAKNI